MTWFYKVPLEQHVCTGCFNVARWWPGFGSRRCYCFACKAVTVWEA